MIGGAIGDKVSSKTMLMAASTIGIILVLAAMFSPVTTTISMPAFDKEAFTVEIVKAPISALLLVLCGFCTSIMWGGIFNLATQGLGKYINAASGIFMTMVVGGGVLPLIQNWVAGMSSYMISYVIPLAGLVYLLYYALIGSKNVNKNIPVD
jgi:Fucose permease